MCMKSKRIFLRYVAVMVLALAMAGCSGVSKDAKKAAKLTNKSIARTNQLKLKEAEKLYKKSRVIIEKYDDHKKRDKFYKIYVEERDKGK